MAGRMTVLPDERLVALRPELMAALRETAREVGGTAFAGFFDASMAGLLIAGFRRVGADEGTVWLLDEERSGLIPRFNSGPHAPRIVGGFRQSLSAGMISMVAATEQPICENEVCKNERQDRTLDTELHVKTWAMLAVPFYFFGELCGVISCVQLQPEDAAETPPAGFRAGHVEELQHTAGLLSRLIEYRILAQCLGLDGLG